MSHPLTERQLQIVALLADGASDREIGRTLDIAPGTVQWHLARIHQRLGTHNRAQAVAVALRRRLLPDQCPCADGCPLCPTADPQP